MSDHGKFLEGVECDKNFQEVLKMSKDCSKYPFLISIREGGTCSEFIVISWISDELCQLIVLLEKNETGTIIEKVFDFP